MKRIITSLVAILLIIGSALGQPKEYRCTIDGVERLYKLHLPEGIKPEAPLVFVLHGYGSGIEHVLSKGFTQAADRHGFAVCYPQGSKDSRGNNCWNVGYPFQADMTVDDISFLCQLAEKLQKEHRLSADKTFLTGMSNGGEMCYLLAYSSQKTFKAVAPIAGLTMAWMPEKYTKPSPIPLFEIHGTEDRVSEWTGDLQNKGGWGAYIAVPEAVDYWVERNGCKNVVTDTLYMKGEGGHKTITHKYTEPGSGCEVWLYEVVGAGHTWFNDDMDTAEEIWKFFSGSIENAKKRAQEKIDRQVDSVFRKLSTREKIAQIMVIHYTSMDSKKDYAIQKRLVRKEKIGGVIPLGYDKIAPAAEKLNELHKLAKIPMLVTFDAEWGVSMRWTDMPAFQKFIQMGALSSDSLVYEVGRSIAQECKDLKIQVNYSPAVDLNNNPERHIVNFRSFGEDKEKVSRFATTMLFGLQDGGVAGCAKHFPGHGDTNVDSHLALPVLPYSIERLDTLELYPFRRLIAAGTDMVMVGHMSIPSLDSTGTPSSISKPIVTGLLREKLGFDGIICTDALDMHGVSKESGLAKKDIPLAAYKAGVDILLMPEDVENAITVIEKALKRGEISMEGLDMRVKKMLALKARMGILDKGYDPYIDMTQVNRFTDMETIDGKMDKKLDLIKKISKETMTVVFNDNTAGFGLPVSFEGKKVAYVGFKKPERGFEFGVIARRYGEVDTLLLGGNASVEELKAAREKVKGHDLVIFGFNETHQSQSRNYGIVPEEVEFITEWAAQQPMIAVYMGNPYAIGSIPEHKNFTAYVVGYTSEWPNIFAAAQVVFGGIPAKGVLPVTSGPFAEGSSILIPERYREEYHHFVGSKADSANLVLYNMKEMGGALTLLPQVAELVAGGKIRLSDTIGELLGIEGPDSPLNVEALLAGYKNGENAQYLEALLKKYRKCICIEEAARKMISQMGMRSTIISSSEILTTGYDMEKYRFTLRNSGKYEGKQVISPDAAKLVLRFL